MFALVPAYNEAAHIADVITTMPDFVDGIVMVDDRSTDDTAAIAEATGDSRLTLIRHPQNTGLGGSLIDANIRALELGADISVVMAGDGQMDPAYLPGLLEPIITGRADFTKGNRFFSGRSWEGMPRHRVFGNVVLTFLTKVATGYWNLFDPQNGYTAISRPTAERMPWEDLARDYSYENDVLAALGMIRARVLDVDIPAVYGTEVSSIKLRSTVPSLLRTLGRATRRRFWVQYVVRSFSPVALFAFAGVPLLLWGIGFGIWAAIQSVGAAEASSGTIMLSVLPFLVGFQLLIAALVIDIINTPK